MAKVIKYKFLSAEINHGTEEEPNIEQVFTDVSIDCSTKAVFDANYPIAEEEAYNGEIIVEGEFDEEPETPSNPDESSVWDELDAAYQEGVDSI